MCVCECVFPPFVRRVRRPCYEAKRPSNDGILVAEVAEKKKLRITETDKRKAPMTRRRIGGMNIEEKIGEQILLFFLIF